MRYLGNTIVYAVLATIGVVLSSIPVAYAFSRMRWKGRDAVFVLVLATMMLPAQVTSVSLYIIFTRLDWIGTLLPLIVPTFFGDAFTIFLLRQFFMTIPNELSEAARIDGASELTILRKVVIPLAKPAIAAVALFQFLYCWNDFYNPCFYTRATVAQHDTCRRYDAVHEAGQGERVRGADGGVPPVSDSRCHHLLLCAASLHRRRNPHRGQGMKIAVIGGGSTYTPELIEGLVRRPELDVDRIMLHDIDRSRLDVVGGLATGWCRPPAGTGECTTTTELDAAVDEATVPFCSSSG